MASSLAHQLSNIKAKAATVSSLDRKKRQKSHAVSLIYEPKIAVTQDFDTIFFTSLEALRELQTIDPRFQAFEKSLFSETSISVDRFIQTKEQNAAIDKAVESFLALIAPRILLQPAVVALEWLVRRFKINELNSELLILTFLPYYSHPIFLRILDIIQFPLPKLFSFLSNTKSASQLPPKNLIIRALSRDAELFALISEHVVSLINSHREWHTLLSFWSSITISIILALKESNTSEEVIAERVLPHVSATITARKSPETQTVTYMILIILVSQCRLGDEILDAISSSIALNWTTKSIKSGLAALTQAIQFKEIPDGEYTALDKSIWKSVDRIENIEHELAEIAEKVKIDKFLVRYSLALIQNRPENVEIVFSFLKQSVLLTSQKLFIAKAVLSYAATEQNIEPTAQAKFGDVLSQAIEDPEQKDILLEAIKALDLDIDEVELKLQTTLRPAQQETAKDSAMAIDSEPQIVTFEDRVSKTPASKSISFLDASSTDEFLPLVEIYLQGLSEKRDLLAHFIKNNNFFPETGLAITFLARLWIGAYPVLARISSLNLLRIILQTFPETVDLQAVIVYLIIALSDSSDKVRNLASELCSLILDRYNKSTKYTEIWGLESLYGNGEATDELKWLGTKDVKALLIEVVIPRLEEAVLDKDFMGRTIAHAVDTSIKSADKKKKENNFKSSVLAFIASHINCTPFFRVKSPLLAIIVQAQKTPVSLSTLLSPLLTTWTKNRPANIKNLNAEKIRLESFERSLTKAVFAGDKQDGIGFLENAIKSDIPGLSDHAAERVVETWASWKSTVHLDIIKILLDLALNETAKFSAIEILNQLSISTDIFLVLLNESKLVANDGAPLPTKRRRRSSASQHQQSGQALQEINKSLQKLTLVLELLEKNKPEVHIELLKNLFTILGDLLLIKNDSSLPVQYTQQVLIECMLPIIRKMNKSQLDHNAARVDIVVNCIRSSTSPQVQNRLLLLVSALAELSPELVLHSVMPIFTFMGANTIRQDDEFSAHVIQQTIAQVVPALAHSTTASKNASGIVELLLSFVNAFAHIPYHRRVKLFTTLVQTLGANESLYLILRLLGKCHWDATSRGKQADAEGLNDFLDSFFKSFTIEERLTSLQKYIEQVNEIPFSVAGIAESKTYTDDLLGLAPEKLVILKVHLLEFIDNTINKPLLRSQIADIFRGQIEEYEESSIERLRTTFASIVENLLSIIDSTTDEDKLSFQVAAYSTLDSVLKLLPIQDFVTVLSRLISNRDNVVIVKRSFIVLRSKFETDAKPTDVIAKNSAVKILPIVGKAVVDFSQTNSEIAKLGLQSIDTLAIKFGVVEPDAFSSDIIELALGDSGIQSKDNEIVVAGLVTLSTLTTALGARLLAFLPRLVPAVLDILDSTIQSGNELSAIAVFTLIDSLIKRIPNFMNSYLVKIFGLVFASVTTNKTETAFEDATSVADARAVVLDNIVNKIQTKPLLAALISSWDDVTANWDYEQIKLYIKTVASAIERGTRKAIMTDASKLFDFLLVAFNSRNVSNDLTVIDDVENDVIEIGIQIVLKLNDKVFRPLFVKVAKWAADDAVENGLQRRNRTFVLFKFSEKLFKSLKSIVTSYFTYLVEPAAEFLEKTVTKKESLDTQLWSVILGSLVAGFSNDQEEFWQTPIRFDRISGPLLAQLALGVRSTDLLQQAIVALAVSCSSEEHYKVINKEILNYMKDLDDDDEEEEDDDDEMDVDSDTEQEGDKAVNLDAKRVAKIARSNTGRSASDVKISAVKTLKAIYERLGEEWLSMLPQLVPIVAELLEDDDETVETEVRRDLVPVIEGVLGESLDRYLN
ncbi:hypothetical protein V1514DRAFT_328929 [Lipomyces japonicus]|uniref:uncharacterized protein n=1 Tax=Lipomyces japonicus TaxID=56871 RepID=UPI0034CFDA98